MRTRICRLVGRRDICIQTIELNSPGDDEVVIQMGAGGICGSDLHYYNDGGFGPIKVKEPIILGHEVSGTVLALGSQVENLTLGDKVALNPSHPCGDCAYCQKNIFQHCLNMRFFGSALRFPHEQGAFRETMVVKSGQCFPVRAATPLAHAACAEPLAVCLHARSRAPKLKGKRILITGAGPIGALCTALAHEAGAGEIVVTDLEDLPLEVAKNMGANITINISGSSEILSVFSEDKGYFDVAFECSAAQRALDTCIDTVRPQGTVVQVGVTGNLSIPINKLVGKEISMIGAHRFDREFGDAVKMIDTNKINVAPIISHSYPLEKAVEAFEIASDRSKAVKVQLTF
jgi:L-idonate 5-dehydrogenase|tara:strand:- start:2166 stop:3203 length:1038 start_codon:yes stop_codon:yes gene_type:complete